MKRFKISIHLGQLNTFVIEEYETKKDAQEHWGNVISKSRALDEIIHIGDVLLAAKQITCVVVEELVAEGSEPAAGASIEV